MNKLRIGSSSVKFRSIEGYIVVYPHFSMNNYRNIGAEKYRLKVQVGVAIDSIDKIACEVPCKAEMFDSSVETPPLESVKNNRQKAQRF